MKTPDSKQSILVWDMPVRVFHWLLVISFAGAWLTSEGERQQMIHYAFGYSACALVLFRIVWGVVGTRYARFTQFIKGPVRPHTCDDTRNEKIYHTKMSSSSTTALRCGLRPIQDTAYDGCQRRVNAIHRPMASGKLRGR